MAFPATRLRPRAAAPRRQALRLPRVLSEARVAVAPAWAMAPRRAAVRWVAVALAAVFAAVAVVLRTEVRVALAARVEAISEVAVETDANIKRKPSETWISDGFSYMTGELVGC